MLSAAPLRALRFLILAGACLARGGASVPKVWVALADKGPRLLPPAASAPASARRAYEDRAVYAPYLAALDSAGLEIDAALKWQNRVSGRIDPARLAALRALPFVASVERMPRRRPRPAPSPRFLPPFRPLTKRAAGPDYGASASLFEALGIDRVRDWMGNTGRAPGQGVRVAVIDADFHLGSPVFSDLKTRIRDQWDFAGGGPAAVDDSLADSHGAECLSLIGGNAPGTLEGAAPQAEFLLYRAEVDDSELYAEEDYVAAAIERAVDSGAQVISISLGYRYDFDHDPEIPYAELDGRARPASLAALGAARRNVIVSVSMGNEADAHPGEPSLGTPADADSILAVGIADAGRSRCGYSSTGPAADGRVKPDVVSLGLIGACAVAVAYPDSAAAAAVAYSGTSFAAPVVAGAVALLRQAVPAAPAERIRRALMATASHADRPDNETGYGVFDVVAALRNLGLDIAPPLAGKGRAPLFHPGGSGPIYLAWEPGRPQPPLELVDLSGRRIPVSVRMAGSILALRPDRRLPTGIYMARVP